MTIINEDVKASCGENKIMYLDVEECIVIKNM